MGKTAKRAAKRKEKGFDRANHSMNPDRSLDKVRKPLFKFGNCIGIMVRVSELFSRLF